MLANIHINIFTQDGIPEERKLPAIPVLGPNTPAPLFSVIADRFWVGGVSTPKSKGPEKVEGCPDIPEEIAATGRAVLLAGKWYAA